MNNLSKGGDFMLEATADTPGPVNPDKAKVEDGRNPSTHPLRRSRTRFDSAHDLVTITKSGRSDWSLFNSAREMDDVTDRGL